MSRRIIAVLLFIFFSCFYFSSTENIPDSINGSQYALTKAIADKHSFEIADYMSLTLWKDYSTHNGKYYSDRDPGLPIIEIPFYRYSKLLTGFLYAGNQDIERLLTNIPVYLSGAATVTLIFLIGKFFGRSTKASLITSIICGIGTLLWKNTILNYRETVFTFLYLITLYLLFYSVKTGQKKATAFISGLTAGLAFFTDNSKFFVILIPLIYIFMTSKLHKYKQMIIYFSGVAIFSFISLFYNSLLFGNPFSFPTLNRGHLTWMNNIYNTFSSPLLPSFYLNLFSNSTIPKDLFPFFINNPDKYNQMGGYFADQIVYKGIFIQSPILLIALFGYVIMFRRNRKESVVLFLTISAIIISNAKLTIFWGNTYDTRYFLTSTVLLLIGLPFALDYIGKINKLNMKIFFYLVIVMCACVSIYNGWISHYHMINTATDLSRKELLLMGQILQPWYKPEFILYNARFIIFSTFSSIYILPVILLFYILPVSLLIALYFLRTYFISKVKNI